MAIYEPFPGIEQWAGVGLDFELTSGVEVRANSLREKFRTEPAELQAVATRIAAVDTGALEGLYPTDRGFTFSVALSGAAVDSLIERRPDARAHIQDQLNAYDGVLDWATREAPVTEAGIRHLHSVVTASQSTHRVLVEGQGYVDRPLKRGAYKELPNNPTRPDGTEFAYASPDDTGPEMARFVEALSSSEFERLALWCQVSYIHYAFIRIHPFDDGNGRVARALASYPLYRTMSIPLIIMNEMRTEYLDALEAADTGDLAQLATFFAQATREGLDAVEEEWRAEAAVPPLAQSLERLKILRSSEHGIPLDTMRHLLGSLQDFVVLRFRELWGEAVSDGISSSVVLSSLDRPAIGEWHPVQGNNLMAVRATNPAPLVGTLSRLYDFRFRPSAVTGPLFRIDSPNGPDSIEIDLSEVAPTLTRTLERRLSRWLTRQRDAGVAELVRQASATLDSAVGPPE